MGYWHKKVIGIQDTEGKNYRAVGYLKKKYEDIPHEV